MFHKVYLGQLVIIMYRKWACNTYFKLHQGYLRQLMTILGKKALWYFLSVFTRLLLGTRRGTSHKLLLPRHWLSWQELASVTPWRPAPADGSSSTEFNGHGHGHAAFTNWTCLTNSRHGFEENKRTSHDLTLQRGDLRTNYVLMITPTANYYLF